MRTEEDDPLDEMRKKAESLEDPAERKGALAVIKVAEKTVLRRVIAAEAKYVEFEGLKCKTCGRHRGHFDLISFIAGTLRAHGEDVMQAAVRVRRELTDAASKLATADVTISGLIDERDDLKARLDRLYEQKG